jgi:flagellar biosynthesis protein FliP
MKPYAILTNRKRSIIALIHSVVFALIALVSILRAAKTPPMWLRTSATSTAITLTIYVIVSSVLILLFRVSQPAIEKLYFAFCASSASLGLLRNIVGDQNVPPARYFRFLMLICAVLTGIIILRHHSRELAETGASEAADIVTSDVSIRNNRSLLTFTLRIFKPTAADEKMCDNAAMLREGPR